MTLEKRTSIANLLVIAGLTLMLAMAIIPLFNHLKEAEWMLWTYTAGALIVLAGRLIGYDSTTSLRIKRLQHILILSGLLYCGSASVKFIAGLYNNWLALLMAGLIIQLYATWMIDREVKKKEK